MVCFGKSHCFHNPLIAITKRLIAFYFRRLTSFSNHEHRLAQELKIKDIVTNIYGENMLSAFINKHRLPKEFKQTVQKSYLPIAEQIIEGFKKNGAPYFVGINGCQGSGKSTLTDFIGNFLNEEYNLNVVVMSLDDFYLDSKKRKALAKNVHPLLATRGVPGTHDTDLLKDTINKLQNQETNFAIPKFNKATDEPFPKSEWQVIEQPADIIILEGWCWGVSAQTNDQLKSPINELELQDDNDGKWRTYVNQQLKQYYQPLYHLINYWLVLQAPSFDCVYRWRLEQERKLALKVIEPQQSKIMNSEQIFDFVQYFQRLSVHAANTLSRSANATLFLDKDRRITNMAFKG